MHLRFTLQLNSYLFFLLLYVIAFSLYLAIRLSIDILLFVRVELHCVLSHNLAFMNQNKKTARALTLGTVRDLFACARKGFMTKTVWRPRSQKLIVLIFGTYVKSLKAPLYFGLDPLPHFFGLLWGSFLKPDFIQTKVPQRVWTLVILPNSTWKMSKPKQKMVLLIFGFR